MMIKRDELFEIAKFFKPKFYNRITWLIVSSGLALVSTSIVDAFIYGLSEKFIGIKIPVESSALTGSLFIVVGLLYNLGAHRQELQFALASGDSSRIKQEHLELDKLIYSEFRRLLPSDGSIEYLRNRNFAGFAFRWSLLEDFDNYLAKANKPEFTFMEQELETIRQSFTSELEVLLAILGENTWYLEGADDKASVPSEWEYEQPERFSEVVNRIHERSRRVCQLFDQLIVEGRIKLGITL